jgi:hypothetical protein
MDLYLNDILKFGKYKGIKVCDLPGEYVQWLREKTTYEIIEEYRPSDWIVVKDKIDVQKGVNGVIFTFRGYKFYANNEAVMELIGQLNQLIIE